MDKLQIVHIAAEIILIITISLFFYQKNKQLQDTVIILQNKIIEQDLMIKKHDEILGRLLELLVKYPPVVEVPVVSPQPVVSEQFHIPQPSIFINATRPQPHQQPNLSGIFNLSSKVEDITDKEIKEVKEVKTKETEASNIVNSVKNEIKKEVRRELPIRRRQSVLQPVVEEENEEEDNENEEEDIDAEIEEELKDLE